MWFKAAEDICLSFGIQQGLGGVAVALENLFKSISWRQNDPQVESRVCWAINSAELRLVPWASHAQNAAVPGNNQQYSFWLMDKLISLESLKVFEQKGELFNIYLSLSEVQKKLPVPVISGFHCCEFG